MSNKRQHTVLYACRPKKRKEKKKTKWTMRNDRARKEWYTVEYHVVDSHILSFEIEFHRCLYSSSSIVFILCLNLIQHNSIKVKKE